MDDKSLNYYTERAIKAGGVGAGVVGYGKKKEIDSRKYDWEK